MGKLKRGNKKLDIIINATSLGLKNSKILISILIKLKAT